MTLDSRQGLVRIVVRLLNESQLLPLALVEAGLHAVRFLESLEGQDEQLRVVLVRQRRERNGGEAPGLQPVDCCRVDGNSFFGRYVWTVLAR